MTKSVRSRKRLNYGGPLTAEAARSKIAEKIQKEQDIKAKKIARLIKQDRNKKLRELHARGVAARKEEKQWKKRVKELETAREAVPIELATPIRDPEKDPLPADIESLEPNPSLTQQSMELYSSSNILENTPTASREAGTLDKAARLLLELEGFSEDEDVDMEEKEEEEEYENAWLTADFVAL